MVALGVRRSMEYLEARVPFALCRGAGLVISSSDFWRARAWRQELPASMAWGGRASNHLEVISVTDTRIYDVTVLGLLRTRRLHASVLLALAPSFFGLGSERLFSAYKP